MSKTPHAKDVIVIELNEFNVELLTSAINQYSLPTLAKILAMPRTQYKTQDRYNSGYLEPWVQWVSIHAGIPSSEHKIKHLGDVPDLNFEQCWETLSKNNVSTGVWGVMNGAKREASLTHFFLPDPWTFSEQGYPLELNNLLDLPRYLSKNYQHLKKLRLIKKGWNLLKFIFLSTARKVILKETFRLFTNMMHYGKKHFVFISYFDAISTLLFAEYNKKFKPQCAFIFLNSLAHIQHHYWTQGPETITPEILFGLQNLENIFATLFSTFPNSAFVIHNGLSQMNTNHERPWILYRQKDPVQFLSALKISAQSVEQHMTHDAHVFFANSIDCDNAYHQLKGATINQRPLFHVERNSFDPCKLFYQLKFTDDLDSAQNPEFECNNQKYLFFKHFDKIVTRTGRHIPLGTIFSETIVFPDHIDNHEFNKYLFNYFVPKASSQVNTHETGYYHPSLQT